jgi:hypothetical protein
MTTMSLRQLMSEWASKEMQRVSAIIEQFVEQEALNGVWLQEMSDQRSNDNIRTFYQLPDTDALEINVIYGNSLRFRVWALDTEGNLLTANRGQNVAEYYTLNRVNAMIHRAVTVSLINEIDRHSANIGTGQDDTYAQFSVANYYQYQELLALIINLEVESNTLRDALAYWNNTVANIKKYEDRQAKEQAGDRGLSDKINKNRNKKVDAEAIENQIQMWQGQVENMLVARTWGWEVEAPNPGEDVVVPPGVERGSDGSVESYDSDHSDCECGCSDCRYHDCDCDDCDNRNDDPQHCGYDDCASCASYEYRTTGGIPRAQHPGLKKLLAQIDETEKNETAGTHIHVYAKDLEAVQIGVVLGAYALTQRVWDVISGRDVENDNRCKQYADLVPGVAVSHTLRHKTLYSVGKFTAVNTLHVTSDRGTIEFRQMNCNFDYDRITFFAWMVRGLVEVAKRGAAITEFFNIVDVEGFIKLYAKYGFTTFKETEIVDDPVGSRYNQSRNRIAIA